MRTQRLAVLFLVSLFLFSCSKKEDGQPKGNPRDYFPTKIGTTWTYKITLGKVRPLRYETVTWPQGNTGIVMASRGFYPGSFGEDKQEFILKMRVKGRALKQGKMQYPIGVELEILEDEFGVFENHKQVFFAATDSGGFIAHWVKTRDYSSPGAPRTNAWGGWGAEDGYTMPVIFFAARPGTQISMGEGSPDSLTFVGPDDSLKPNGRLQFLRVVKPAKKEERHEGVTEKKFGKGLTDLEKGFEEHMWFTKGKGLVLLKQTIDGETSMKWLLIDFLQ